ncbi:nitrogen regulation protein NR(II) [Paenibacillus sp. L3-i20]|uniref:two-component system sensor histidine kinase NtrB n=1 Tax=Paenibacillus sp. L3-i20 TaxID=2905833 RepID=UPI001EDCFFD2|nr:ATP-binding protein [Paenibacillus sp. L3-i20]GKU80431.1 hypothetical protein L3i20_v248280 [Paenibacillus sp. L3-i20]
MIKDLLLQFFLSVLPVFTFLLLHNKEHSWKGFENFIAIMSGISIVLCMLTTSVIHQNEVDFRLVPYLIGSLYGGYRAIIGLTLLYAGLHVVTIVGLSEKILFIIFIIIVTAILLVISNSYKAVPAARKKNIGIVLISVLGIYLLISTIIFMSQKNVQLLSEITMHFLVSVVGLILASWLSIYIIENISEKQQLLFKVKQLSSSYRNEAEKLQQFIDRAPLAVMIVDQEGIITHVNEECLNLLSLQNNYSSVDELKNVHYRDALGSKESNISSKLLEQALHDKALHDKANTTLTNTDDQKMVFYTNVTLRDMTNNDVSGAVLIAQDATELSRLRVEIGRMERLSLVGQMAASITHEIRNPMAVIRGFVQLIQERSPQNHYEYFKIILNELDRTNLIINDFLSLAQNRKLKMESTSLNASINELVPLLQADANMRGQTVEVDLCPELPPLMLNDREVKQMLLNIARNGMEAMREKGILRIATHHTEGEVSIHISDNGIGIPQDKMVNLFEPFFTTKSNGTGLGLPLCLSIAERHQGRIDIKSVEGIGTTFIITFKISKIEKVHSSVDDMEYSYSKVAQS